MAESTRPLAPGRALALAGALSGLIAVLDQLSKWAIVEKVMAPPRVIEITGFFNLVLTHNTGISFGILRGSEEWVRWILVAAALGIVAVLLLWLRRDPTRRMILAIGLIGGGAISNVIDRIFVGAVIDFLDFHAGAWHWPAFNLADSAITLGVLVLVLDSLFRRPDKSRS